MAKKISFESEVDAAGFSNGLKKMEAAAAAANGRMNATAYQMRQATAKKSEAQTQARAEYEAKLEHRAKRKAETAYLRHRRAEQGPDLDGSLRSDYNQKMIPQSAFITGRQGYGQSYFAKAKADQMRAEGLSRFGVASSMFVSVARDSAASLASGAPAMQVLAQQAPQVLQAVTMIGGGIMRWGLGLGAAAAALIGFHYLAKKLGKEFTGEAGQERQMAILDSRSAALKKVREEQNAEFAREDERESRADAEASEIRDIGQQIGDSRLGARMAKESDPIARQKMLVESLKGKEMIAGMDYERLSQTEFSGMEGHRLAARKSELALAEAQRARTEAESQLRDLESGKVSPIKSRGSIFGGDALTQVGNFLGSGSGLVNSIGQQQLDEARKQTKHLQDVVKNTATTTTTSSGTMDIP